jgi:hypothetical protein
MRIWVFGFGLLMRIWFFDLKSEIQPVTHQRIRKNMAGLKNDWFPIPQDNPNIMKEAGVSSIRKNNRQCEARENRSDQGEESLDGKPKAVTTSKNKLKLKKITYGTKNLKKGIDQSKNVLDEVQVEFCNSNAVAEGGSSILLSPGQITLGNDSYLDGYSHASNYSGTYYYLI